MSIFKRRATIYMPLTEDDEIVDVIRGIGEPLIVETTLPAAKLTTFFQEPWGRILLSSYHVSINPEARQEDVDAYVEEPVPPESIVSIEIASSWR